MIIQKDRFIVCWYEYMSHQQYRFGRCRGRVVVHHMRWRSWTPCHKHFWTVWRWLWDGSKVWYPDGTPRVISGNSLESSLDASSLIPPVSSGQFSQLLTHLLGSPPRNHAALVIQLEPGMPNHPARSPENWVIDSSPISGGFPQMEVPQDGWYIVEHPLQTDDLGGTTILRKLYMAKLDDDSGKELISGKYRLNCHVSSENITYCGWKKYCTKVVEILKHNGINHLSTGARFLPSIVSSLYLEDDSSSPWGYPKLAGHGKSQSKIRMMTGGTLINLRKPPYIPSINHH